MPRKKIDRPRKPTTSIQLPDEDLKTLQDAALEAGYTVRFGRSKGSGNLSGFARAIAKALRNERDRSLLLAILKKIDPPLDGG